MNDDDPSDRVWSVFGDGGRGIAIRSTPERLSDSLSSLRSQDGPAYIGRITYIDHGLDVISDANALEAVFVVRSDYEYEQEARAVICTLGTSAKLLYTKSGPYGSLVQFAGTEPMGGHKDGEAIVPAIDFKGLADEVLIGKHVPLNDRGELCRLISESGLPYREL